MSGVDKICIVLASKIEHNALGHEVNAHWASHMETYYINRKRTRVRFHQVKWVVVHLRLNSFTVKEIKIEANSIYNKGLGRNNKFYEEIFSFYNDDNYRKLWLRHKWFASPEIRIYIKFLDIALQMLHVLTFPTIFCVIILINHSVVRTLGIVPSLLFQCFYLLFCDTRHLVTNRINLLPL